MTLPRKRKGFSMMEVLVIVAVVGLGLLPILTLFSQTAKRVAYNEDMAVANLWAVQLIERHRMVPFDILKDRFCKPKPIDALTLLESDLVLSPWWQNSPMTEKSRRFLKQYEVSLIFKPDSIYPDFLGQLVCTVSWKNKQGVKHREERVLLVEKRQ
ncbi:MAG: prepilin-type N-terminal cleavage/methylation domain-containing protein [bacterium]|jgi:hypothetical protein|nr:prepilin-type N-terminal cleavage/methylation domain-containing protein [bacterium]